MKRRSPVYGLIKFHLYYLFRLGIRYIYFLHLHISRKEIPTTNTTEITLSWTLYILEGNFVLKSQMAIHTVKHVTGT